MAYDPDAASAGRPRPRPGTTASAAAGYRPRRVTDYLFLHGLALSAARRALRQDRAKLYPPADWSADDGDPRPFDR